jgi:hypothetical protein
MATLPLEPDICYKGPAHAARWYLYGLMADLRL